MPWLINPAQLDKFCKSQKNVIVLDASFHLETAQRDAHQEFLQRHIPGARFLNLTEFHDKQTHLPNMLSRDEGYIAKKMGELGITNEHKIIFYDQSDLHSSCRALWMFKVFGHSPNMLYILDGGLASWEKDNGKVESGEVRQVAAKSYNVNFVGHYIRTLIQMKTNAHHPTEQVIDLRHAVRFAGGPEHRAGLRCGHIPGSFSFPYQTMFDKEGRWKPLDKIRKQLWSIGVEFKYPIVTLCGSGITAAILNFFLDLLGYEQHALYDGSWSEWGADTLYHGETSLAERPVQTSL